MILQDILLHKGSAVHCIDATATLDEVVRRLVEHNVGALVVCESRRTGDLGRMVGIITERDIMRELATGRGPLEWLNARDCMTSQVVVASPQSEVADVMGIMTERRIRHLPVVDDGQLAGIISIGDLVKAQHDQMVLENHYLKSYIQG